MSVVISNGFHQFHLSFAAESIHEEGFLHTFITGAYLGQEGLGKHLRLFEQFSGRARRWRARAVKVPSRKVYSLLGSEILEQVARSFPRTMLTYNLRERLEIVAMQNYGSNASRAVKSAARTGAKIYHYRAGYGGKSLQIAKDEGLFLLCDHSIAHPAVVDYLIHNKGKFPDRKLGQPIGFWGHVMNDIDLADTVLVNSDFVKSSFLNQGWDESLVKVIYLGVDDKFLSFVDLIKAKTNAASHCSTLRIIFAGGFEERKGVRLIIEALQGFSDQPWSFEIVGSINPDLLREFPEFFANSRVHLSGWLSRERLAERFVQSDVLLFPSYAEGSARVIFEAQACGCFIITTLNSGSTIISGHGGEIIAPEVSEIDRMLRKASSDLLEIRRAGIKNCDLVRNCYTQSQYGRSLISLYSEIIQARSI